MVLLEEILGLRYCGHFKLYKIFQVPHLLQSLLVVISTGLGSIERIDYSSGIAG